MKPIVDLKDSGDSPIVVSLTGDGEKEKEILEALAKRYDGHDKSLLLPTKPPPIGAERRRIGRFSGLSAFQVAKTFASKWGLCEFLVIIDIEHFGRDHTQDCIRGQIEDSLNGFGFTNSQTVFLNERACRVRSELGAHRIRMNAALSGHNRRVEENISELLKLEYDIDVAPEKRDIHNAMHQLDLSLEKLLVGCREENLARAFPGLVAALKDFENQDT